jgi:integrase
VHAAAWLLVVWGTGLRRGELLALHWGSIDFNCQLLTVESGTSKRRQTRHVPLNNEATSVLQRWFEHANGAQRVFRQ